MHQGTTHILTLEVEDVDLTGKTVQVSLRTVTGKLIEKTNPDLYIGSITNGSAIAITLSQEETLALPHGPIRIQVRWIDENGNAGVSDVGYVDVQGILTDNMITYGGTDA